MEIIWNPREIENRSMEIIEQFLTGHNMVPVEKAVVSRVVHATGDPAIIEQIKFHPAACRIGIEALRKGTPVFTDVSMLQAGINRNKVKSYGGDILCSISAATVAEAALDWKITRSAASMRLWGTKLNDGIIAIGNAPTALFEIVDLMEKGIANPAMIVGTPVGFVGATESKALLVEKDQLPYITVLGTRGGSPIAAAILNALLYFEGELSNA